MFTIKDIVEATRATLIQGQLTDTVKRVSIDSRDIQEGDVFVAIKGDRFDGHDFIKDIATKPVKAIIVHHKVRIQSSSIAIIRVKDTTKALGDLAHWHRKQFDIPVIAITGSAGKTTTKEMMAAVLKKKFNVLYNVRSFNNHIGVPLTLFKLNKTHDMVVMECGTNQPGDIAYLANILRPTATVLTIIGESHLEKLKTCRGVLKEKWQLNKFLPVNSHVFINGDDKLLASMKAKNRVSVGQSNNVDWQAKEVKITSLGKTEFTIRGKKISLNTTGTHQVNNALLVIAVASAYKIPLTTSVRVLNNFEFPEGRGKFMKRRRNIIIDDAYNANPISMRAAIDVLAALDLSKTGGRKIMVMADMLELGSKAKQCHQHIGTYAMERLIDIVIAVGPLMKEAVKAAKAQSTSRQVLWVNDYSQAIEVLCLHLNTHDAVLVKGSHAMKMEHVVQALV